MKRLILAATLFLLTGAVAISGETIEKVFKTSPDKLLSMDLSAGGSIYVYGWDKDEIKVVVFIDGRDIDNVKTEFEETAAGLEIACRYGKHYRDHSNKIEFEVKVPQKYNLELDTQGGSITVEHLEGDMRGRTAGGNLELVDSHGAFDFQTNGGNINCERLTGRADLKTNGGNITCSDSQLEGEARTGGGRVWLDNVTGDFDATSSGGDVVYASAEAKAMSVSDDVIHIRTMGGDIDVDDAPQGADLHTNGGDITVHSADKFVKALTNGGDITIEQVDGSVEAHTNGGDITIKLAQGLTGDDHDIEISSNSGDIKLLVPEDFSAKYEIELAFTRDSRQDYRIISDFELKLEKSDEWDYDHGSPRKYIYGHGESKDAASLIRVRTINGNVTIKKI